MNTAPRKIHKAIAALSFPVLSLCGCGTAGFGTGDTKPYVFDVPRPLQTVYAGEVDMFRTCLVGRVSTIFDLNIDPWFDAQKQTATISVIGAGYFSSQEWNLIEMQADGSATHMRINGAYHSDIPHLPQQVKKWANGATDC